jgi:isocitrate dehydrogenase
MTEYNLKEMWKSPNATIRAALDGTVFRAPILTSRIKPYVQSWKKPITLARHAYGDIYKASEYRVPSAGKAELVFTSDSGEVTRQEIFNFKGPGIIQGIHNIDASIEAFAVTCFEYALSVGRTCGSAPRIPFQKPTTVISGTYLKGFITKNTLHVLRKRV